MYRQVSAFFAIVQYSWCVPEPVNISLTKLLLVPHFGMAASPIHCVSGFFARFSTRHPSPPTQIVNIF
jgi:hypothetical protein